MSGVPEAGRCFREAAGRATEPWERSGAQGAGDSRRARAMAADFGAGAPMDSLPKNFLDGAFFAEGTLGEEVLKKEKDLVQSRLCAEATPTLWRGRRWVRQLWV